MYRLIESYIDTLLTSQPDVPLWNIEAIKLGKKPGWNYIDGCITTALLDMYQVTGNSKYLDFVINFVDYYVDEKGDILGYHPDVFSTDDISESRVLFDLYKYTKKEKYLLAIDKVYEQIKVYPRTKEGNFWHKQIYANQVWLDGLYMIMPFYARYETEYNKMKNYNDIVNQFKNVRKIMFDDKKGLYYHAYDSVKKMFWADKKTGLSKNFWLRAIGWYTIALVDVFEIFDEQMYDERRYLGDLLKEIIENILKYQDPESKMFYQVVDKATVPGNYLETSGSAMISYAILKGCRLGILPKRYYKIGEEIFNGICGKYLTCKDGKLNLGGICLVSGLGPEDNLRRDGTFEYYISEPIVENEAKGVGPLVMAYVELKNMEKED